MNRLPGLPPLGAAMVTTFGLGLMRPAPGTWGSMPPPIIAWIFLAVVSSTATTPAWSLPAWWIYHVILVAILVIFSLACLVWGDHAEAAFGKKDPGSVCADETAGVCFSLMFLPWHAVSDPWRAAVAVAIGFLSFRVFDILKLPPARGLQKIPSGMGVLVDDLVAGLQAMAFTQLLVRWLM